MPKFKTFTTEQGFFELAVAAPSRAAALRAWGMKHDLFGQGLARESQDNNVIAAALARPGIVLRRPLGSKGPFRVESDLPVVKNVPRKKPETTQSTKMADREKAANALKELDETYRRRLAALQDELHGVQTQIREVSRAWKDRRRQFTTSRPKVRR